MRTCKTCRHKDVKAIDAALVRKVPYREISEKFDVPASSVSKHAANHVKPLIQKAQAKAEAKLEKDITQQIIRYRKEVHFSVIDKVKWVQNELFKDLQNTKSPGERIQLYRTLTGTLQEEARLSGLYQRDRVNRSDVELVVEGYRKFERDFPDAPDETKQEWVKYFAAGSGIDESLIAREIQVQNLTEVMQ